jgi:TPR repeat protein
MQTKRTLWIVALLLAGCANQPQTPVTKPKPKDLNSTTTTTSITSGYVYANQKNYYLSSCQNGNAQGCRDISTLYEKGLGVKKDLNKALYYVIKGCKLNHANSCTKAGNLISHSDKYKAASYYQKGCELGDSVSCNNIGNAYIHGSGVVKNLDLAETYLNKALSLGYNAYNNLGFLYEIKGNTQKAISYFTQGCDKKDSIACSNLAGIFTEQKDYYKAYNYYIKSCNLANSDDCNRASMMIYKKFVSVDNPQQTMFHLDANSCEMNNKIGCSNLAYDYHNGIGVAKNLKKAKEYYKKACKLGHKNSCNKH